MTGESWVYYGLIPEEDRYAFANRDYATALKNIITLIDKKGIKDKNDIKFLINYFNKAWDRASNGKPSIIFIPLNKLYTQKDLAKIKNNVLAGRDNILSATDDYAYNKLSDQTYSKAPISITPKQIVDISAVIPKKISRETKLNNDFVKILEENSPETLTRLQLFYNKAGFEPELDTTVKAH